MLANWHQHIFYVLFIFFVIWWYKTRVGIARYATLEDDFDIENLVSPTELTRQSLSSKNQLFLLKTILYKNYSSQCIQLFSFKFPFEVVKMLKKLIQTNFQHILNAYMGLSTWKIIYISYDFVWDFYLKIVSLNEIHNVLVEFFVWSN